MGISVPTTNLKKYTYINLDEMLTTVFAVPYAHYMFLQDVDFSEIDEIGYLVEHRSNAPNVQSEVSIEIDRTTSIWSDAVINALNQEWGFIDVTGYTSVRELGFLWDISGAGLPASCQLNHCYIWGKKGLV